MTPMGSVSRKATDDYMPLSGLPMRGNHSVVIIGDVLDDDKWE